MIILKKARKKEHVNFLRKGVNRIQEKTANRYSVTALQLEIERCKIKK